MGKRNLVVRTHVCITALAILFYAAVAMDAHANEKGFLGMQVQGNSVKIAEALELPTTDGVLVRDISVNGPAARSGIARGDLIVNVHGTPIDTFERLLQVTGKLKPDDEVEFVVSRLGKTHKFKMILSSWPDGWSITASSFAAQPDIGITFAALTPKMRKHLGLRWGTSGIAVSVSNDGFAGLTSLTRGDVVVQINQKPVWDPKQFLDAYASAKKTGRNALLLLVERPDGFKYMIQPIIYPNADNEPAFKIPGMQGG